MDDRRPDAPDERLDALFAAELAAAERDYPRIRPNPRMPRRPAQAAAVALMAALVVGLAAAVRVSGPPIGPPAADRSVSPSAVALIPVPTAAPPGPNVGCRLAMIHGTLVSHEEWGIAMGRDGEASKVIWPNGYAARDDSEGRALLDANGEVTARTGDIVEFTGSSGPDAIYMCHSATVTVIGPDVRIAVPTARPLAIWEGCPSAAPGGTLVAHDEWGVALEVGEPPRIEKVLWPNGFTALDTETGRILVDDEGAAIAQIGDVVAFMGGYVDGGLLVCARTLMRDGVELDTETLPVQTHDGGRGDECLMARVGGTLVHHETWGIAIRDAAGNVERTLWPKGYVGRMGGLGLALVDESGQVVARSGDLIVATGGHGEDSVLVCAGTIEVVD